MGKVRTVSCKNNWCKNEFEYSEISYQKMLDHGDARPEYCEQCKEKQQRLTANMGANYFSILAQEGVDLTTLEEGELGSIYHPRREHKLIEIPSQFDPDKFGITEDDIREIYEWFKDKNHRVVIVEGPTGAGKSSALPYWLLEPPEPVPADFFTRDGQIMVTEPRIIAAERVAGYLTYLLGSSGVGKGYDVGIRHSRNRNRDWRNRIFPATDGSLVNMIQEGELGRFSLILIDEAHERSLNIDVILRLLAKQLSLYPHLKLIIGSATINAPEFTRYFGEDTAKIVSLKGMRKFKYQEYYASEEESLPYDDISRLQRIIVPALAKKVLWLLGEINEGRKAQGDILAFLHGVKEIEDAIGRIQKGLEQEESLKEKVDIYPLHASLPQSDKKFLEEKGDPERIRVIVSTNVAEASLTVEGVVYVVDSGLEYQSQWDKDTLTTRIPPVLISQANAKQRWGRSGRTQEGEVYCFYTEDQFNLMDEYPTPAIQRSSMEDVIIITKAAGLDDVNTGWLDSPSSEEIERSLTALKKEGALSKDEFLTEYGYRLRYFPYPTELADLIMEADQFGCAMEIATLLPIIKNGGHRHILVWKYNWDAYTKRDVSQIHRALMKGCHDDIEFCLKLYSLWCDPPGSEKLKGKEKEEVRKAWAKANFVNHVVFTEDIEPERETILNALYGHKKDQSYRPIDFTLLDRVRILLAYCLPNQRQRGIAVPGSKKYVYDARMNPEPDNTATYKAILLPEWETGLEELERRSHTSLGLARHISEWERKGRNEPRVANISSRLFLDQKFPVGEDYQCVITRLDENFAEVRLERPLAKRRKVEETFRIVEEEDIEELDEEDIEEEVEPEVDVFTLEFLGDLDYTAKLVLDAGRDYQAGDVLEATVVDHEYDDLCLPALILKAVPEIEPFDSFWKNYELDHVVKVEVSGYVEYPGDFRPVLSVKELKTDLEVLMELEQLAFTYSQYLIRQYPLGFTFRAMVEKIDKEQKRVYLSLLPLVESTVTQILEDQKSLDGSFESVAEVVEVRDDGKVFLMLDWSIPEEGIFLLVKLAGRGLFKPVEEFVVDERYRVRIDTRPRTFRVGLSSLPEKVESILGWEEGELSWEKGRLTFEGRMTNDQLYELKSLDEDPKYYRALDKLYWLSNRLWIATVMDPNWVENLKEMYPIGTKLTNLKVKGVKDFGLFLEILPAIPGFVPRSKMFDAAKDPDIGDEVTAVVVEINEERMNLILDMKIPENDPITLYEYEVGEVLRGVVEDVVDFGAFVKLETGFTALAHRSNLFGGVADARSCLKAGDEVVVKVLKLDIANRKISLGIEGGENK